jgi:septal ring factor EnvC (AmiA/AmiB activator)
MPDTQPTEKFEAFYDEETKIAANPHSLPSQDREQLREIIGEARRLSEAIDAIVGQLNGVRADVNRIDQTVSRISVEVRTVGMALRSIDGPVRQIQNHLKSLGAALEQP